MNISVKKASVKSGGDIIVDVALTNVSSRGIQIWRARSGPPAYTYQVTDRNGKPATRTPMGQSILNGTMGFKGKKGETRIITGGGSSSPIAPGETLHDELVISDFVDLSQPDQYNDSLET